MRKTTAKKKKFTKKPHKLNLRSLTVTIILLAVLLALVINAYQTRHIVKNDPTKYEKSALVGLSEYLNTTAIPKEYGYDDWVLSTGERVPLESEQIVLTMNGNNGVGKYGKFSDDSLNQINEKFVSDLQEKIKTYFISQNFTPNAENTVTEQADYYTSTYAFQKDNLYCLSHVAKESEPFAYISCGTIDAAQIAKQKELEDVYETESSQNNGIPILFRVNKIKGDFAKGTTAAGIGGYEWLAKNIEGKWEKIWSGQEIPLCSEMAQYEVPQDFYPGCYNPETEKEQRTY